jgi:hypothetical protein
VLFLNCGKAKAAWLFHNTKDDQVTVHLCDERVEFWFSLAEESDELHGGLIITFCLFVTI